MSAGTRWLRAAVALSEEHVRTQRAAGFGPDKPAFFGLWSDFQGRPRWAASGFSELDSALIVAYALAACGYTLPNVGRNFRWSWEPEEHGLWAGGNRFGGLLQREPVVTP